MDRKKKWGGESKQNLRDHKEFQYTQGDVIYVQYPRVYLTSQNVLSQFQKLNYLKKKKKHKRITKIKTQSLTLVTVYSWKKKKNPFPVN